MLFEQISTDIMSAMKAHDKVRTQALRNVKKFFIEAKTAPGSDGELTDEAAIKSVPLHPRTWAKSWALPPSVSPVAQTAAPSAKR